LVLFHSLRSRSSRLLLSRSASACASSAWYRWTKARAVSMAHRWAVHMLSMCMGRWVGMVMVHWMTCIRSSSIWASSVLVPTGTAVVVRGGRTIVVVLGRSRHTVVRSCTGWTHTARSAHVRRSIHARVRRTVMVVMVMSAIATTSAIAIVEPFSLDLALDSLAIWRVSDHGKDWPNDGYELGSLTWLCVIQSRLNDVIRKAIP